nr:MAG: RNA-dependent RNA polymerase [brine shrimp iflavirus 3]
MPGHVANSNMLGGNRVAGKRSNDCQRTHYNYEHEEYESRDRCLEKINQTLAKIFTTGYEPYDARISYTNEFNSWIMRTDYESILYSYKNYGSNGQRDAFFRVVREIQWNTLDGPVIFKTTQDGSNRNETDRRACYDLMTQIRKAHGKPVKLKRGPVSVYELDEAIKELHEEQRLKELEEQKQIDQSKEYEQTNQLVEEIPIRFQMEQTEQGIIDQTSDRQENTIITRDAEQSSSHHTGALDTLEKTTSSEPTAQFHELTGRWMPLDSFKFKTSDKRGTVSATYYLPETFYKTKKAPNIAPIEAYIYARMDVEIKFVVNANKFHCGKALCSVKYDSYQAESVCSGYQSGLARNHVILDLSANNEGSLIIPFRYHRPFVRTIKTSNTSPGVRPSKYATVYVQVLSPLQAGAEGLTEIECRTFYRFKNAEFTGMSYRVPVSQMMGVEQFITNTSCKALKEVLVGVEKGFDQLGKSKNQDKPSILKTDLVCPQPMINFGGGKGGTSVIPLRVNPQTLTNYVGINCPTDEPKDFYDLSRIWGIYKASTWAATDEQGTEIFDMTIDPTCRSYSGDYTGELTPLEYACSNFMFWSGTIEIRLDFVSNTFHSGAVMLSAEFGRKSEAKTEAEIASTYTKTFHLEDQKSVSFNVPYIYDTLMRRTTNSIFNCYERKEPTADDLKNALTIAPESFTKFKVTVLNQLRPIQSAPQSIEVLMFIRGGKNFVMHGLKSVSHVPNRNILLADSFPRDGYLPVKPKDGKVKRKKRSPDEEIEYEEKWQFDVPAYYSNDWNEPSAEKLGEYLESIQIKSQMGDEMDNGEKEDLDQTENFGDGRMSLQSLTLDCHMSFKDLLRRPTLLFYEYDINKKKNGAFFIPLQPPCRDFCALWDGTTVKSNGGYAATLQQTSAVSIMDMFRCWRGGMRYTIILESTKQCYVTYIPHSGTRIIGRHSPYTLSSAEYLLCGANYTSAVIIPSVNPTITVEVPYETENTWTLTFDDDALRNYSWRDKGDYNSGHLALITSDPSAKATVWWHAADDFQFANFYGMPTVFSNGWKYRYSDDKGRTLSDDDKNPTPRAQMAEEEEIPIAQMDRVTNAVSSMGFRLRDAVTNVTGVNVTGEVMKNAGLASIPIIGMPLTTARLATELSDRADKVGVRVEESLDKLDNLVTTTGISIEEITALLKNAVNQCTSTFQGAINGGIMIYNFLLDVIIAWMEKSWRVMGVAIVRCITQMCGMTEKFSSILDYGYRIGTWLSDYLGFSRPRAQMELREDYTLVGLLCGLVGTLVGVNLETRKRTFSMDVLYRLTTCTGVNYLVGMLRFVQQVFTTVKSLIMEALGYVTPQSHALKMLAEHNGVVEHFVREAQIITSEANGALLTAPNYRNRCWKTILQAYQIQRLITQVPTNAVSAQLVKVCADTIKFGNEKFMDLCASPVRYEPFVLFIEGPPGVGKSFAAETIVKGLLRAINYNNPSSQDIHWMVVGQEFVNGYRDQPCMGWDEYMNSNDKATNQRTIMELMKLKSTALYMPNKADLNEKNMRANPLILIVLTNNAFPNLADYATCPKAVARRKDECFRVELTPEYLGKNLSLLDADEKARLNDGTMPHLQFKRYTDVTNVKSLTTRAKNFEQLMLYLTNRFQRYHHDEIINVNRRMEALPQFAEHGEHEVNLLDPFTLFYNLNHRIQIQPDMNQNAWTPYEQMEQLVQLTDEALREQVQVEVPIPYPDRLSWNELPNLPRAQSFTFIAGALLTGTVLVPVLTAGVNLLRQWCEEVEESVALDQECSVCRNETKCVYTCANSRDVPNPHLMCVDCFRGVTEFGNGNCPVCRCTTLVPSIKPTDMSKLLLWKQMALRGGRGIEWLLMRMRTYYGLRNEYSALTFVSDMLIGCLDELYVKSNLARGMSLGYLTGTSFRVYQDIQRIRRYPEWQMDDEIDDWEDPPQGTSRAKRHEDNKEKLRWRLDEEYVEELCMQEPSDAEPLTPCLHKYLIGNERDVAWNPEGFWIVLDRISNRRVPIPCTLCNTRCELSADLYRSFLNTWGAYNTLSLRHKYIDYLYEPTKERCLAVPRMFRPQWMQIQEIKSENWFDWLGEKFEHYKTAIVYLTGAIATLGTMYGMYRLVTFDSIEEIPGQGGSVGSADLQPRQVKKTEVRRVNRPERRVFQNLDTSQPPTVFISAERYVVRNMMKIHITREGKQRIMYGIGVFGHHMIVPKHYLSEIRKAMKEGYFIEMRPVMDAQLLDEVKLTETMIREAENNDIAIITLPPKFPLFKDIRKYMRTAAELENGLPYSAVLVAPPRATQDFIRELDVNLGGIKSKLIILGPENKNYNVHDVIEYNYSQQGACGAILMDENHQKPIISIHVAGRGDEYNGEGYGELLTRELIDDLFTNEIVVQMEDKEYASIEDCKMIVDECHLRYHGSLPPEETPFIPTKSKLVKSLIHGVAGLDVPLEPAILSSADPRYTHTSTPLYEGIKKHGILTKEFSVNEVKRAQEQLWDGWLSKMTPLLMSPQKLTLDEAVAGFKENQYYQPMDLKTSAGYPYVLHKTKGGLPRTSKEDFITPTRDSQERIIGVAALDPTLEYTLKENEKKRQEGIIPHTIFIDTLKDEKRKHSKVKTLGGTRVFCSSPVDNVIAMRQNFMHFIAAFMSHRHKLKHAVGINPTSEEWTELTNVLLAKNDKVVTIDYSNFGPGFNSSVAKAAFELIIRWVKEHVGGVNDNELQCLMYECIQSMHVANNTVYQQFSGSPSGSVITTTINTIVNQLYVLIAWNNIMRDSVDFEINLLDEFLENVAEYMYGDDCIMSVTEKYIDKFNVLTITEFFKEYGIIATDAAKTGNLVAYESIKTATFLKRGFKVHPYRKGEWLSPLDDQSVRGATQWVWKSANMGEATRVNCAAALMNAHGHGPDYFNNLKELINKNLRKRKIDPIAYRWEDIDNLFYSTGLEWVMDGIINKNMAN